VESGCEQVLVHPGMVLLAFYFHIAVARQRDGKNTINGHRPHETTVALSYGFRVPECTKENW
jgi:hypothetical protein